MVMTAEKQVKQWRDRIAHLIERLDEVDDGLRNHGGDLSDNSREFIPKYLDELDRKIDDIELEVFPD